MNFIDENEKIRALARKVSGQWSRMGTWMPLCQTASEVAALYAIHPQIATPLPNGHEIHARHHYYARDDSASQSVVVEHTSANNGGEERRTALNRGYERD